MFNDVAAGQFVSSAIGLRRAGRQRDTAGKCDIWERRLNANGHLPFVIDGRPTARQATAAFASKRGYKGNNRAPGGRAPHHESRGGATSLMVSWGGRPARHCGDLHLRTELRTLRGFQDNDSECADQPRRTELSLSPTGRVPPIVDLLPPHPALRTVSAEARPGPSSMMLAARYSYGEGQTEGSAQTLCAAPHRGRTGTGRHHGRRRRRSLGDRDLFHRRRAIRHEVPLGRAGALAVDGGRATDVREDRVGHRPGAGRSTATEV